MNSPSKNKLFPYRINKTSLWMPIQKQTISLTTWIEDLARLWSVAVSIKRVCGCLANKKKNGECGCGGGSLLTLSSVSVNAIKFNCWRRNMHGFYHLKYFHSYICNFKIILRFKFFLFYIFFFVLLRSWCWRSFRKP